MVQLVIEHPDPPTSLEEAESRVAEMIRDTEKRIRKASKKAVSCARSGCLGADENWAADAADANIRWTALVDAWEALTGRMWESDRKRLSIPA